MKRSKTVTLGADIEVFVTKYVAPPPKIKKGASNYQKMVFDEAIAGYQADTAAQLFTTMTATTPVNAQDAGALADKILQDQARGRKKPQIIPCVGLIKGTKAKPHTPKGWPEGYAVQEDNVMLEYNVPATSTQHDFINVMTQARQLVKRMCKVKGLMPVWKRPEHEFLPHDLVSPQAKLFACEPDLDAYNGGIQRNNPPDFGTTRTCGGHIHVGGDFNCPDFVAILFMELILALYMGSSAIVTPGSARSKWYGKPGVFRIKPYGVEYRTLSNSWATSGYILNDVAMIMFRIGQVLVDSSAKQLQTWFRRIEWMLLQELLLAEPVTTPAKAGENQKSWQLLRQQYNTLNLPGLAL